MDRSRNYAYMVKCCDGSYYSGWTTDIEKRIKQHNEGKQGAKYTRSRRPVSLAYYEIFDTPQEAMSREWHLKQMSHKEKDVLAAAFQKNYMKRGNDDGKGNMEAWEHAVSGSGGDGQL